jgi:hypothetical protein
MMGLTPPEPVFADTPRPKGTTSILSLSFFALNCYHFPRPMNFKVANKSFHVIIPGKGATSPQKLQHLRNGVGCQVVNLDVIGRQDINKFLRDWQTKTRSEKISEHNAFIFSGLRRGLLARQTTNPGPEATL